MTAATLPAELAGNPRLSLWVSFPSAGRVAVSTGRVELGQGVLTAMVQIAAEELDVAPERIALQSGDTRSTPDEGHTAGSRSIQYGGMALRAACAEVRALFLNRLAERQGWRIEDLAVDDGTVTWRSEPTEHSYWTLADAVDLAVDAAGGVEPKAPGEHRLVGKSMARVDLAGKVFGQPVFIHDLAFEGMLHARVIRQPGRTASIVSVDEEAIRQRAKAPIEFVRRGNFLAVVGEDETAVEAAAAAAEASELATWDGVEPLSALQEEARWLLQRPSVDRLIGDPEDAAGTRGMRTLEATYTRPHLAHASIAPSCAIAQYSEGVLQVWTHSQGVFPLRQALARTLKLPVDAIAVAHVQGPGCYGHNGADDVAADAAIVAVSIGGRPVRVRWRREEEFGFEPVGPAMAVKVRAAVDDTGKPVDWTTEIWSGPHSSRPARGRLLAEDALPDAPPFEPPARPEGEEGGARNGEPLYDVPSKRILHHFIPETPVRTSALRSLGAMANVFSIECFMDELAEAAGRDPVAYRLSLLSDARAAGVVRRVAEMSDWREGEAVGSGRARGMAFARYKNLAAYAAVVVELEVEEEIRLLRAWCAADAGFVINPDGAANQLEGGIVQSASWVLKEQVRLAGGGVGSRDWESYPVLRFTDVPEVSVALVNPTSDLPPLGLGECTAGPTAAAIGNAVARALGTRLRDLPLTRERVMAALLAGS